uniref:Inositol-tetrakisphosphate 1-kinase n=1 Tax=Oryza nivara TaxID=4536 RepID=A0A0E0GT53_ORYNI
MSGEILVASVDDKSGTPLKCSKSTLFSLNSQVLLSQVSSLPRLQAVAEDGGNVERRTAPSRPLSTTAARGRSSGGGAGQMWRRRWAKPRALAPLPLSRPEPDRSGSWVARSRLGSPDLAVDGDGGLVMNKVGAT